jgi:hypothetical protein
MAAPRRSCWHTASQIELLVKLIRSGRVTATTARVVAPATEGESARVDHGGGAAGPGRGRVRTSAAMTEDYNPSDPAMAERWRRVNGR